MAATRILFFFAVSLAVCTPVFAQTADCDSLERIGTITHPPIREASGLVASRRSPGVLWTITDSQGKPHLYAIDRSGRLLAEYEVRGAANLDWESIAIDDRGFLYIADVGNNLRLPVRWIYQVREPDPRSGAAPGTSGPVRGAVEIERILPYTFPQQSFDVEGTFVVGDSLYLISKVAAGTAVYRLRLPTPAGAERGVRGKRTQQQGASSVLRQSPVTLPACELDELGPVPGVSAVTGADYWPDGRRIAITTYREAVVYLFSQDVPASLRGAPVARVPFRASAVEGCCWQGRELLLVSEDRSLYRVKIPGRKPAE